MFQQLREKLPREFPGTTFYFLPSDIVTQVLNFGLPAPIDVQIEGADIDGNRVVAAQMLQEIERVPGVADARVQQAFDYPAFDVTVDRPSGPGGLCAARYRQQHVELAEWEFPDHAMFFP